MFRKLVKSVLWVLDFFFWSWEESLIFLVLKVLVWRVEILVWSFLFFFESLFLILGSFFSIFWIELALVGFLSFNLFVFFLSKDLRFVILLFIFLKWFLIIWIELVFLCCLLIFNIFVIVFKFWKYWFLILGVEYLIFILFVSFFSIVFICGVFFLGVFLEILFKFCFFLFKFLDLKFLLVNCFK